MTKEQRHLFAKLVIALADENRDEIVKLMKDAGYVAEWLINGYLSCITSLLNLVPF